VDYLNSLSGYANRINGMGGNDVLYGANKDDVLSGGAGNDTLYGAAGNDIMQGGSGADNLSDTSNKNLFDGGGDNDVLGGGSDNELYIGGSGDDTITTGSGYDIIAFNKGDGRDTVSASSGTDNTLSLGKGITYADLLFDRSGNDLILATGATEQITFKDWYASVSNKSISTLQMVIESSTDYDPTSTTNELVNHKISQFNFNGLVSRFDNAKAANPTLTSWSLSSALIDFHLASSDTAAIGGDLACQYANSGTLSSISTAPAQALLASQQFGVSSQNLQSPGALQDLTPRLA
jgi:Ca2+-binding RTX toxin-like protein